jgi:hypothetical protein
MTVDTSTLKVDSANNRVGIGTASPTALLDVVGAASVMLFTTGAVSLTLKAVKVLIIETFYLEGFCQ